MPRGTDQKHDPDQRRHGPPRNGARPLLRLLRLPPRGNASWDVAMRSSPQGHHVVQHLPDLRSDGRVGHAYVDQLDGAGSQFDRAGERPRSAACRASPPACRCPPGRRQ